MSGYFRSLLAELMPGWAFWRSNRRPTTPFEDSPVDERAARLLDEKKKTGTEKGPAPVEPDLFEERKN